ARRVAARKAQERAPEDRNRLGRRVQARARRRRRRAGVVAMLRSFRARLVAGFAVVIVLTLVLAASAFVLLLREQQAEAARQRIGTLVGPITEGARNMESLGWPNQAIRSQLTNVARYYDIRILMVDSGSHVVVDTDSQ